MGLTKLKDFDQLLRFGTKIFDAFIRDAVSLGPIGKLLLERHVARPHVAEVRDHPKPLDRQRIAFPRFPVEVEHRELEAGGTWGGPVDLELLLDGLGEIRSVVECCVCLLRPSALHAGRAKRNAQRHG